MKASNIKRVLANCLFWGAKPSLLWGTTWLLGQRQKPLVCGNLGKAKPNPNVDENWGHGTNGRGQAPDVKHIRSTGRRPVGKERLGPRGKPGLGLPPPCSLPHLARCSSNQI